MPSKPGSVPGLGVTFMPRGRKDVVDTLVGSNIRVLRQHRSMSQTDLATKVGVTFQQIQKYENGSNRVGSGRLYKIATVLKVPIGSLFDGVDHPSHSSAETSPAAMLAGPYALRLLRAFSALADTALRKSIAEMVEKMPVGEPGGASSRKR
jgi:transcriptional regulator with XRE-family HTH domain